MITENKFLKLDYEKQHALLSTFFEGINKPEGVLKSVGELFRISEKPSQKILHVCFNMISGLLAISSSRENNETREKLKNDLIKIHQIEEQDHTDAEGLLSSL